MREYYLCASALCDRSGTNECFATRDLDNELQRFRETGIPEVGSFAPRLAALHDVLGRAMCDAYGWEHEVLDDNEEILRRLLALNLERAAGEHP